ncbi:MAG: 3D domain-containing protein [Clostridiales Family XIII bacterium]|nr:3D domain-containing protein [Clostridiales Family XIII bacterium]
MLTRAYWAYYAKRFGAAAAALSVIAVFALYGFALPASAVITPDGELASAEKALGGVEIQRQELQSIERTKKPAYGGQEVALGSISPDLMTLTSDTGETLSYAGSFRITHYCACSICCGKSTGITASGAHVSEQTVAADWNVFPVGTVLYIKHGDSLSRKVVEDRGGGVNGQHIDVYVPSHEQALQMGSYTAEIYVPVA